MIRIITIGIVLILIAIGGAIATRKGEKDKQTVSSQMLHKEVNDTRRQEGKPTLTAINGDTNTYARKDTSWNSTPDFFRQLIKGRRS